MLTGNNRTLKIITTLQKKWKTNEENVFGTAAQPVSIHFKVYAFLPSSCKDTVSVGINQHKEGQGSKKAFCGANKMLVEKPCGGNWALWVISSQFIGSL